MVCHRIGPCRFIAPLPLVDIERVAPFKLLGVYIGNTLSMETHVNYVPSLVYQRLCLINQLENTGLSAKAREVIFHALIASRLLYTLLAFAGFLSCADIARLNALYRKSVKWGILDHLFDFDELLAAENRLFKRF
jgi:hypothetical protein